MNLRDDVRICSISAERTLSLDAMDDREDEHLC
jgi:hypothetical protein